MNLYLRKGTAIIGGFMLMLAIAAPAQASTDPYYQLMPVTTYPVQYQYQYQPQVQTQSQYTTQYQYIFYLLQLINQLQLQLTGQGGYHYYSNDNNDYGGNSEISITTRSATSIQEDEARLQGTVDFNDSNYAYVWFEYGEDDNDLNDDTPHVKLDDNDDEDFYSRVTDLDDNTRYYFRAVGEDDNGDKDYGTIKNFRTDDNGGSNNNDDEPDVTTSSARDITNDSAELRGEVDMNDFDNGLVFFVYGQDRSQVRDIESDYDTYSDIDEDGDDLQKERVDSGLDGRSSYSLDINGLDDTTNYYFAMCVQYEDDSNDDVLSCGSTEDFETDN